MRTAGTASGPPRTAGRRSGVWSTIPTPSNWELHGFGSYNYGGFRYAADVILAGLTGAGRVTGQLRLLDGTPVGGAFSVAVTAGATSRTSG